MDTDSTDNWFMEVDQPSVESPRICAICPNLWNLCPLAQRSDRVSSHYINNRCPIFNTAKMPVFVFYAVPES
ncbi:MAG TPA: hypothetical protein VK436_10825, partial [Methanocella sp.]|nr:hypothetical protein [Methanocella sp.]